MSATVTTSETTGRKRVFLGRLLPRGSWQRRLVFWLGGLFLALLLLGFLLDQVIMPRVTRQGTDFELPSFIGMQVPDADNKLQELNLNYAVAAEEYAPNKEKGTIINQFPVPGTRVKPGRQIKFVVSLGQKFVKIPQVGGESVRQAILDLEAAGLKIGEIAWAYSDTIPERVVVFSYPSAGAEVPISSAVNLMVNRGRATNYVYMPKVIGLPLDEAVTIIEGRGLKVGKVDNKRNQDLLPETVLEQSVPEGTELELGSAVDLVVSEG